MKVNSSIFIRYTKEERIKMVNEEINNMMGYTNEAVDPKISVEEIKKKYNIYEKNDTLDHINIKNSKFVRFDNVKQRISPELFFNLSFQGLLLEDSVEKDYDILLDVDVMVGERLLENNPELSPMGALKSFAGNLIGKYTLHKEKPLNNFSGADSTISYGYYVPVKFLDDIGFVFNDILTDDKNSITIANIKGFFSIENKFINGEDIKLIRYTKVE